MNKQPFYHRAVLLFTGTQEFSKEELEKILRSFMWSHKILQSSITVEECDAEPGDPADLM